MKKALKIASIGLIALLALVGNFGIQASALELSAPTEQISVEQSLEEIQPFAFFATVSCATSGVSCNVLMFSNSTTIADRDIIGSIPSGSRVVMNSTSITNGRMFVSFNGTWGWVNSIFVSGIQWQ